MPAEAQTRLLRVLQEGEYVTVGGRTPIKGRRPGHRRDSPRLARADRGGSVREDLYYRLNVVPIRVPPLRERTQDIPALVRHFMTRAKGQRPAAQCDRAGAMQRLQAYRWPGNVPRTRKSGAPIVCASIPSESIDVGAIDTELAENPGSRPRRARRQTKVSARSSSGICVTISLLMRTGCRPAESMTESYARSNGR